MRGRIVFVRRIIFVERVIVERGHSEDIKKLAIAQGMMTLRQAGLIQAVNGLTSVEEVFRVVA